MIKEPLSVLPLDPVTRLTGHSVSSLRLRSKGMPALQRPGRGDLYIELAVETPVNLTRRQKELLEELAKEKAESSKRDAVQALAQAQATNSTSAVALDNRTIEVADRVRVQKCRFCHPHLLRPLDRPNGVASPSRFHLLPCRRGRCHRVSVLLRSVGAANRTRA